MKGFIIIIVGLVLFAGGLINIQNQYFVYIACLCGGALVGIGIEQTLRRY